MIINNINTVASLEAAAREKATLVFGSTGWKRCTPGKKYDTSKLRWDLLPLKVVRKIVEVLTFGAVKYEEENWKTLADAEKRYYAALMRHLDAWQSGELLDSGSGKSHLAHAACNIIFLLWFEDKTNADK